MLVSPLYVCSSVVLVTVLSASIKSFPPQSNGKQSLPALSAPLFAPSQRQTAIGTPATIRPLLFVALPILCRTATANSRPLPVVLQVAVAQEALRLLRSEPLS